MGFLIMKNLLREGFITELKSYAAKLQAFNALLSLSHISDIDLKEQKKIIHEIIKPLFKGATKGALYGDGNNEYYGKGLQEVVVERNRKYKFLLDKDLFAEGLNGFWAAEGKNRGTILWANDINRVDMVDIFKKAHDPFVLGNLGATMSKSAIRYAKKLTIEDEDKIVFGLSSSNGLEWLVIFMSPVIIGDYVELAIKNCSLSEHFMLRYSMPV